MAVQKVIPGGGGEEGGEGRKGVQEDNGGGGETGFPVEMDCSVNGWRTVERY